MSATPRMRSAFPATPGTTRHHAANTATPTPGAAFRSRRPLPQALSKPPVLSSNGPVIPESIIEIPSQRFYAFSVYGLLAAVKLFDYWSMNESEGQSLWLFLKWAVLDGAFLFGLPSMRIPWLEWSSSTMLLLFIAHLAWNMMLMFQVSAPLGLIFSLLGKSVWGAYEKAITENSVSIQSILHNDSLLLGRQIIHILPEGSAILNPEKATFCLDDTITEAKIPLRINSTNPIAMDLLRIDLETQANETLHFNKQNFKAMHKEAARLLTYSENFHEEKTLFVAVKKPGLYSLLRVVDETNLEVSRKAIAHTVIVPCPRVKIESLDNDKCRGELSNINLEVTGTPPLRVKYHKAVNQVLQESVIDSIQPEEFYSPLSKQDQLAMIVAVPNRVDTEWAKPQTVVVPMNEHLGSPGTYAYSIDEVRDGFGNEVVFGHKGQSKQERSNKDRHLHAQVEVHERPVVSLERSTTLKIASGKTAELPVKLASTGRGVIQDAAYQIEYLFTPANELSANGEHSTDSRRTKLTLQSKSAKPLIREPGLYTLSKVSTEFCSGEVIEPASVLLENPPQPDLLISSQEIFDKCAGRPIGLRVDLDLTGTPPFTVVYTSERRGGGRLAEHYEEIRGHRGQLMLTPPTAGHYNYRFVAVHDAVYKDHDLKRKNLILEQDVKPSAGASFVKVHQRAASCLDDAIPISIDLKGEGPFNVEYELLHGGKRNKFELTNVDGTHHSFSTPPLSDGGEYTVALKTIKDLAGCTEFLNDEIKLNVRHQKPKVAFGKISGANHVDLLQGKKAQLPLRLVGEAPWTVKYRDPSGREHTHRADSQNDRINADSPGTYQLLSVDDATCPGYVDEAASDFSVSFIARPEMRISPSERMTAKGDTYIQQAVCEGEEDAIELLFKGAAPWSIAYTEHIKPLQGIKSPINRDLPGLQSMATVKLDTSAAGTYNYKFTQLSDANYEHSSKHFSAFSIQQQVYARPSAAFKSPGKMYSFCSVQADGEEVIPIDLHGEAPFDLELEVKHHGAGKPEIISLTGIQSNHHSIKIPHKSLHPGKSSVSLRRISDSRGCSRILDSTVPRVQIAVFEPPSIYALESTTELCVGDHIQFGLSGQPPFTIYYKFNGHESKAVVQGTTFRRLAEKPGTFVITGVTDHASSCKSQAEIVKHIHGLPSARVSRGQEGYIDLHEGGTAEILFEFGGVPPFEFTYQRSANTEKGKKAGVVLDTRSEVSDEHSMRVKASEEGTYEVIAIKDRYCAYSKASGRKLAGEQKRLTY